MTENERNDKKAMLLAALRRQLGIVSAACEQTGVPYPTYKFWYNTDEEFRSSCDDIINLQLDFVENKLLENIKNNDTASIIFYLKTKGKKRGYSEKILKNDQTPALQNKNAPANRKKKVEAKKNYIVKLLKKEGRYSPSLLEQVEITASLIIQYQEIEESLSMQSFVITQTSREGDTRAIINPLQQQSLQMVEKVQKALRALGMNLDTKQQNPKGDDPLAELINKVNNYGSTDEITGEEEGLAPVPESVEPDQP